MIHVTLSCLLSGTGVSILRLPTHSATTLEGSKRVIPPSWILNEWSRHLYWHRSYYEWVITDLWSMWLYHLRTYVFYRTPVCQICDYPLIVRRLSKTQNEWSRPVEFWMSDPTTCIDTGRTMSGSSQIYDPCDSFTSDLVFYRGPVCQFWDYPLIVWRLSKDQNKWSRPRACWFNMASLVQWARHASSDKVIPPSGYSEKVVPPVTKWPCILNLKE